MRDRPRSSTVDINKVTDQKAQRPLKLELATNQPPEAGKDLAAVMRLALDEERKGRSQVVGELAHVREELGRQQALLGEREKQILTDRWKLVFGGRMYLTLRG